MKVILKRREGRLEITTRAEAVRNGTVRSFDRDAIEIHDGVIDAVRNARLAEERGLERLAVWCMKYNPKLVEKLELTPHLPKSLR